MAKYHCLLASALLVLAAAAAAATQFSVGGSKGWSVPDPNAMSYNQWAEKNRFQVGDALLFVYLPEKDSVLLVDNNAYSTCNTSSFIDKFDDGNTVFTFATSGPFYFISGNEDNCKNNEKFVVVVMADRSNKSSLAPSPSPETAVAASPPSPSEAAGEGPTAPPPPPPNGAASTAADLVGMLGTILAALFYLF